MKQYLEKNKGGLEWGSQRVQATTQVIVLWNAKIESRLKELLIHFFSRLQSESSEQDIKNDLGSIFSSTSRMISVAYHCGLISKSMKKDLLILNNLRNKYAHSHDYLKPLEDSPENFSAVKSMSLFSNNKQDFEGKSAYSVYSSICNCVCDRLENITNNSSGTPQSGAP